jgi:hypothetical protein
MDKYIVIFIILVLNVDVSVGQGFAFGPKGGLSIGQQNFSGYQRDALFAYHGALYIESLTEENKNALFAQIGYHIRGSALRIPRYTNINGQVVQARTQKSTFENLALYLGGKQKFDLGLNSKWYFDFALRGEYNLSIELPGIYSNIEDQVNKFVYGVSVGIGAEFMFSELVGALVEFNAHPDISDQIVVPAQRSINNPNVILPEQRVRNVSYELTVGFRFLRKIEYID